MKKIQLNLEHCYGIKKLQKEFDFKKDGNVFIIYAPNGVMKTSLAKTFRDLSEGVNSADRIWENNKTTRIIQDENGADLGKEDVFVINPYDEIHHSGHISTLLVNERLRKKHTNIYKDINEKKDILISEMKAVTKLKGGILEEFSKVFIGISNDFPRDLPRALRRVQNEVEKDPETPLGKIAYADIFNPKVESILNDPDFTSKIKKYIETYNDLISKSNFFRRGVFTHNNAEAVAKNLENNGFFKAEHSVYIRINEEKKEISTLKDLEYAIESEKKEILTNESLKDVFEKINTKLQRNADLRKFRDFLEENMIVLEELDKPDILRQKLWVQYLIGSKIAYHNLLVSYAKGEREINKIVKEAAKEQPKWTEVIRIFNERFFVPFDIRIGNQVDVILKKEAPIVEFYFLENPEDPNSEKIPVEEKNLIDTLSNGENRALYILNIIFEVEGRKATSQPTLFIVDDIADSFDYKNKYAIVEYLMDISAEKHFRQLILTHNFDFYRTISGRLNVARENRMIANRENGEIIFQEDKYKKSPFTHWRKNLNNESMLIASIPVLRNLAEFSGDSDSYKKLTSLLHIKSDTDNFSVDKLNTLIDKIVHAQEPLNLSDSENNVKDLIYKVASNIAEDSTETANLEDKVTLSIAIRLKTEEFMISRIKDPQFLDGITTNQTINLIKKFKEDFKDEKQTIKLLDQVNLMTPENIHLNSFMYEPILDMSAQHLKKLFTKVNKLNPCPPPPNKKPSKPPS